MGQGYGRTAAMALCAGRPGTTVQTAAMAESAGRIHQFGRGVTAGGSPGPQGSRVSRTGGMAAFTTVGQITDGHVKARIVTRTGIGRGGMAGHTTGQVVLGVRSVLQGIGVRHRMGSSRARSMATARAAVPILPRVRKTTGRVGIGTRPALLHIVADGAGSALFAGAAMA